jgi:hypothetical protein
MKRWLARNKGLGVFLLCVGVFRTAVANGVAPREFLIGKANRIVVSADILDHWHSRLARTGTSLD